MINSFTDRWSGYLRLLAVILVCASCSDHSQSNSQVNSQSHSQSNAQSNLPSTSANEPSTLGEEAAAEQVQGRGEDKQKWWNQLPRVEWSAFERIRSDIQWFEIYQLPDQVYAIYEPGQFEEVISFLIIGEKSALLFDTGLGLVPIKPVVKQLTDLDVVVINSHSHYDHVGGNHEFTNIAALDNDYTQIRSLGTDNQKVIEFVSGEWLPFLPFPEFSSENYRINPWKSGQTIQDGFVFDLGGRQIEVLHTPGHAPDAVCLLDRDNRILFTGDTFYLAPLYAHLEGSDFSLYKKTAKRLAALDASVDRLLTSHNVPQASSDYLQKLEQAFIQIEKNTATFVESDGAREYDFGDFSIITPHKF